MNATTLCKKADVVGGPFYRPLTASIHISFCSCNVNTPAKSNALQGSKGSGKRRYLKYARIRKHTAKLTHKAIGKQLRYLKRYLAAIDGKLRLGKMLKPRQQERLEPIRTIYQQQKYMYDHHTHSVLDRIVSVSQPFVRPIVRGKAICPVEFGAKLGISVVDGWTRLEYNSFDAYSEAGNLQKTVERFAAREGHYPKRILADRIYRNRENLSFCKEHGIRLSGPALGRLKKDAVRDRRQDYLDDCERVEVERRFSLAKRKCGLGLITAAAGNCCPCNCHVRSGTESAQGSVCHFAVISIIPDF